MSLSKGATKLAREFARAVVRRRWADLLPLFTAEARTRLTADTLAAELGWEHLGVRLRREFIAATGEAEEMVPELDPPRRFEVFEVEDRDPPAGHDPAVAVAWVEVDFLPREDSGFDTCYNCFLAVVEEGGPRVAAHAIEAATD